MMKKLKEAAKFITSLLIMFSIIGMLLSIFVRTILLNPDFYINSLKKTEYFTLVKDEINYGFKNYSIVTSIPEDVFKSSVTDADIINLASDNIRNAMAYMKYKGNYKDERLNEIKLEINIKTYVVNYSKENKLVVDDTVNKQIKTVTLEASNIVNSHTILFDLANVIKYSEFQKFRKILFLLYDNILIMSAALILLIVLLFLFNDMSINRASLWLGAAIIPAGLTVLIPSVLGLAYKIPYRFSFGNYYLKLALSLFTLGYLKFFLISGGILLIVTVTWEMMVTNKSL